MFRLNIIVEAFVGDRKYEYKHVKLIVKFESLEENEVKPVRTKTALNKLIEAVGIPVTYYHSTDHVRERILHRWISLCFEKYAELMEIFTSHDAVVVEFKEPIAARDLWNIKKRLPDLGVTLWKAIREWALQCSREWSIDGKFHAYSFIPMVGGNQDEDSTKS